jgi:ribonuclease BN (tRNA processing enzyme)
MSQSFGITVLGSSGTWASADSGCSGYLLDHTTTDSTDSTAGARTTRVWVDCGPGSLSALQQHCQVADLDAVVVTHEHPDHFNELPVLRNAMVYGLGVERLPLYAPRGVLALLETLVGSRGITPSFTPKMVGDQSVVRVGSLRLQFSRTDHSVETVAVRAEPDDHSAPAIAYSSDTGPGWSLAALGEGIGLAVVEATWLAAEVGESGGLHRTAAFTGADTKAAGVPRLVVTHIPPTGDPEAHRAEAEASFGAPVAIARPHERYTT